MKIVHTADWHIGAGRTLPEWTSQNEIHDYLQRTRSSLLDFCNQMQQIKPDLIIVAGDLFEWSEPSPDEYALLLGTMLQLDVIGAPIVVIPGQHCQIKGNKYALDFLHVLTHYRVLNNLHYTNEIKTLQLKGLTILAVPFSFNPVLGEKVVELKPDLVAAHVMVKGSRMESGHLAETGYVLDYSAAGYWALGDIHKTQEIRPNVWYSGSLLQRNFGESLPKGYLVYDTDTKKVEFHEVKCERPLVTLDYTEGMILPPNCFIRLRIEKLITAEMPTNVVRFVYKASQNASIPSDNNKEDWGTLAEEAKIDLFTGLEDELRSLQLTPILILRAVELANVVRQSAGL